MTAQTRRELIDDLMDVYVDWRQECAWLEVAYGHWSSVPSAERGLAFAAYRAALDREERASSLYAERFNRVAASLDEEDPGAGRTLGVRGRRATPLPSGACAASH